jgi:hypothetical protein
MPLVDGFGRLFSRRAAESTELFFLKNDHAMARNSAMARTGEKFCGQYSCVT